jgi:imidazoleglycerol-phosphate dehydratase/histidinol-phosphatase
VSKKILFIDRDGTLITEPFDQQIDRLEKFALEPETIPALLRLRDAGWTFVMVTNQDGLGTPSFREEEFKPLQKLLIDILLSQGISFEAVRVCPHTAADKCDCRKPKLGLLPDYVKSTDWAREQSYVIGDRETDEQLAQNLGCRGLRYDRKALGWTEIARQLVDAPRRATIVRHTKETKITVSVDLDQAGPAQLSTGLGFFDHMLEQIARHGNIDLNIKVKGDLHIDEHHTVEDVAITLGDAFQKALGGKKGIERYGFTLPMDDCLAQVAIDFGGRPWLVWDVLFIREKIGELPAEMIFHFFKSFSDSSKCNLNIRAEGENEHHKAEAIFKAFAKSIKMAVKQTDNFNLPSTKGTL